MKVGQVHLRWRGEAKRQSFGELTPSSSSSAVPPLLLVLSRQKILSPCWTCGNLGHLAANCPKKTNQYPFVYSCVHSPNNDFVYVSKSNGDPLDSRESVNAEICIESREVTSYCDKDSVNAPDAVSITKGDNNTDLVHSREVDTIESVMITDVVVSKQLVDTTDDSVVVQTKCQHGVDFSDNSDYEG